MLLTACAGSRETPFSWPGAGVDEDNSSLSVEKESKDIKNQKRWQ
jgi:hypothetical protein